VEAVLGSVGARSVPGEGETVLPPSGIVIHPVRPVIARRNVLAARRLPVVRRLEQEVLVGSLAPELDDVRPLVDENRDSDAAVLQH
jgi:hypothetical protein